MNICHLSRSGGSYLKNLKFKVKKSCRISFHLQKKDIKSEVSTEIW